MRHAGQDSAIDRQIALAAAGGNDHVDVRQNFRMTFDARGIERKTGGIRTYALPVFHLALVALFRNLQIEIHRRQRMHDKRREGGGVGGRLARHQFLPVGLGAFAEI